MSLEVATPERNQIWNSAFQLVPFFFLRVTPPISCFHEKFEMRGCEVSRVLFRGSLWSKKSSGRRALSVVDPRLAEPEQSRPDQEFRECGRNQPP